ncbi:uncharacterized protein LOC124683359 [Lolium rigidum]|uniref:uncharacterized protein LOC124683359 n=1 Tax=Lolium rigidum TaxID=89674 RepID=UPI001F5C636F|nr:uncharacterized protein LOC124683359 [Lolium rigidum]
MVGGEQEQRLVQESAVPVISSGGDPSCPAVRLAHFLHPRAGGAHRPAPPSPPRDTGPVLADGLQVEFKGWAEPPILWKRWVDKLRPRYELQWRTVGILDAILATTYRVRRDDGAMLQLAAIWSAETNTFLFPWGEATVTLEDVSVLGGLPLLGRAVRAPLEGVPRGDVEALQAVRRALYKRKGQKPDHPAWVRRFLEPPPPPREGAAAASHDNEAAELLEHGAFLAMWLSLFVLPEPPFDLIRTEVLPIAARLARGGCVALAPAVLASIYIDLSTLNHYLNLDERHQPFVGWAPLHILQLWVFARFPELRPEMATTLDPLARHQPWAARWHEVRKEIDPMYLHAVFMSPREFEWRPYGSSSFAPPLEKACSWVYGRDIARSKQLQSFAQCLRACELVGMRCIEQYNPHRVARQLGFDQDVPGSVARADSNWEIAWGTYMMEPKNFAFIVPQYVLAVTIEYAKWWEPYSLAYATAVANSLKLKESHALVSPRGENMDVLHDDNNASKEKAPPDLVIKQKNSSSEHGEAAHHHLVKGAVSTTSSKATGLAHLQSSLEDIMVVSDGESDELVGMEHEVGATQIEGNEKANEDASASKKQSGPLLEDCAVVNRKSSGKNKMSSSNPVDANLELPKGALSTTSGKATGSATVAHVQSSLENIVVISDDESDELVGKEHEVGATPIEGNEKANKDASASNKQSGSILEDCEVVNRKSSGNNKMSSSNLVDANPKLPRRIISTNTLYYLKPFGRVKDAHDRDAAGTNTNQGAYLPRREVGTREMIEEASAAREAEKVVLQKTIDSLQEEIAEAQARLRDSNPKKV